MLSTRNFGYRGKNSEAVDSVDVEARVELMDCSNAVRKTRQWRLELSGLLVVIADQMLGLYQMAGYQVFYCVCYTHTHTLLFMK